MIYEKTKQKIKWMKEFLEVYGQMTLSQIQYKMLEHGVSKGKTATACRTARRLGYIPYEAFVDRSRPSYGLNVWKDVSSFADLIPDSFNLDYWVDSDVRVEIWTEKDALSQILWGESKKYGVPVRATRGWLSMSNKKKWGGDNKVILYFGDFDPSGLCMDENLKLDVTFGIFERIALTLEQIEKHNLPSIKVKTKDSRASKYKVKYGNLGWELDALSPDILKTLVRESIEPYVDFDLDLKRRREEGIRDTLREWIKAYQRL